MRKKMFYGVLSALTLGLAACSSNDDLATGASQNQKAEYDQTQYIAVQISAPSDAGTRATFEHGTKNESAVNRLDFFFYDVAGNPTSVPKTLEGTDLTNNVTFTDNTTAGANVTRICTSVIPVALTQGQNFPSQVICIVNGIANNVNDLKTLKLGDLIDVTRTYFRNGTSFLMSNSVYYGRDVLTGRDNQRLCATPINANSQLFGTEDDAKEAITNAETAPNALVDIYVERVAAKVGLTMGTENVVENYTLINGDAGDGSTISLTFTPEYWAMNATDNSIYLTKRYGVENVEDGSIDRLPTYSAINKALGDGGFTTWNDKANYRSYWGCSPSYFTDTYPDVSDDVDDLVEDPTVSYGSTYYSYNAIKIQAGRPEDEALGKQALAATDGGFAITNTGDAATGYIYTRETTVAKQRINDIANSNPAAAVASAVLVGKYKVSTASDEAAATTFYIDRNAGTGGTYYANVQTAKNKLAARQSIVYTSAEASSDTRAKGEHFELAHPVQAVRDLAGTKLSGRLVTLQLTEEVVKNTDLYYYDIDADNGNGDYVRILAEDAEDGTKANLDKVNAQLLSVGYMDMFADGLAFFSVPIRHLNWKNEYYKDGKYQWADMASGSLGVVRNHVYNLTITKITGLGTALRDPDQPIVPAKEEANQYIAARLNILAWRVVPEWSVEL